MYHQSRMKGQVAKIDGGLDYELIFVQRPLILHFRCADSNLMDGNEVISNYRP